MSKEDPYRDQAERLRQRIEKIQESDVLKDELPPRSNLHRQKSKKTKVKVKYPVIRLLVLFFILLPITIFSAYSYLEDKKNSSTNTVTEEKGGYETINFQRNREDEGESDNLETNSKENTATEKQVLVPEKPVEKQETLPQDNAPPVEVKTEAGYILHKVKRQETLYRIAMKYYQSSSGIEIIKKDNNIGSNEIQAGQILKIRSNSK